MNKFLKIIHCQIYILFSKKIPAATRSSYGKWWWGQIHICIRWSFVKFDRWSYQKWFFEENWKIQKARRRTLHSYSCKIDIPSKLSTLKRVHLYLISSKNYDQSIGSTETKYIKLNTKAQNIFCCVNENLTTFFIHFDKKKQKEKKRLLI